MQGSGRVGEREGGSDVYALLIGDEEGQWRGNDCREQREELCLSDVVRLTDYDL